MADGTMQHIRELLSQGLTPKDLIAQGFAESSVYACQRKLKKAGDGVAVSVRVSGRTPGASDTEELAALRAENARLRLELEEARDQLAGREAEDEALQESHIAAVFQKLELEDKAAAAAHLRQEVEDLLKQLEQSMQQTWQWYDKCQQYEAAYAELRQGKAKEDKNFLNVDGLIIRL